MSLRLIVEIIVIVAAAAIATAAPAFFLAIAQLRRTMARAALLRQRASASIPALASELSLFTAKLDRAADALAFLAGTVEHVDACVEALGRSPRQGWNEVRQKLRRAAMVAVSDAAGTVHASRKALRWIRISSRYRLRRGAAERFGAKEGDNNGYALWLGDGGPADDRLPRRGMGHPGP